MQSFNFNSSISFQDLDVQMEVINHFSQQNPSFLDSLLETTCSSANQQQQQSLFQTSHDHHSQHGNYQIMPCQTIAHVSLEDVYHENKRRKLVEQSKTTSTTISPISSASGSGGNSDNRKKKIVGKGKREMKSEYETEDFIHVRARRGQATDSHSLAERVRRAKINNKLKCLQNLVPGCHETMGMAGTLDEIINYVHSLQNQVQFLSMELAAASSCYGFSMKTQQKALELQECEMMQECKGNDMDRCLAQQGTDSHEQQDIDMYKNKYEEITCFRSSSTWTL